MKLISIITITYNNYEELKKTLNSIPKTEVIESVVINGGRDLAAKDFLKTYNGVVLSEPDNGIADAFNKGIRVSNGKYLMFLNSGDVLLNENYLQESLSFFKENKEYGFTHSNLLLNDIYGGSLIVKPRKISLGRGMPYLHPTMIFRKEIFDNIGFFNTNKKVGMDFDLIVRMIKAGIKGMYIDCEPVVLMEGTGQSVKNEFHGIKECYHSLKENKMLGFKNISGMIMRVILYSFRKILVLIGLKNLLGRLKRLKYKG